MCTANLLQGDTVILDEIWRMLIHEASSEIIYEMVKLLRGYGSHCIMGTQDITDITQCKYGEALLNATKIKFFLSGEEQHMKAITEMYDLNTTELLYLKSPGYGKAIMVVNGEKTLVHIETSPFEDYCFNTDKKQREKYAALKSSPN